ncbi:hypothetical protein HMPREF1548_06848 [Clostridium sp. KLE 1755]|nr:hypothetical protein HMPREF1548_06848 [Clostridium sp. KLE 1755]
MWGMEGTQRNGITAKFSQLLLSGRKREKDPEKLPSSLFGSSLLQGM